MQIEVTAEHFDPWQLLLTYKVRSDGYGATAVFVGTMRDSNQGDTVVSMQLEHYPEMVRVYLDKMVRRIVYEHQLHDVLLVHRVGEIKPGEAIMLVAVWSQHRREACVANREIVEALKAHAPFWKKERLGGHNLPMERWVDRNTPNA